MQSNDMLNLKAWGLECCMQVRVLQCMVLPASIGRRNGVLLLHGLDPVLVKAGA